MNIKRLFGAFIAAFIFAFLFEWFLHRAILRGSEAALPQGLARAPADFQSHFPWVVVGKAIMVFIFTLIYARGFAAGGVCAGVGLGIMFGIIYTGANLSAMGATFS
jgi:Na+/H+ antiporter NhaC